MNILLVYPEFAETFWGWGEILTFVGKKAAFTPTGLLTVAAMLPSDWEKKVVDINVRKLTDEDIKWADYVFVSAMIAQRKSAEEVIRRCKELAVPVVLGGPILEIGCDKFADVEHFLLGEVENTLAKFVADLRARKAEKIYPAINFPDLDTSPIPLWGLIDRSDYACMLVQYGRGCPWRCRFCNIALLNGNKPRAKTPQRFLLELGAIYDTGYRGSIMFADDNLIGNKRKAKEMLRQLIAWQQEHGHPFSFIFEADVTLADDEELMDLLVRAGFKSVFLGLETPNEDALRECGKVQNLGRDLVACVRKIQQHGLIVMSGFIVGFDADDPRTFVAQMTGFIRDAGVVTAMLGMLQAQPGTKLYERMEQEGRLLRAETTGINTDNDPNFRTMMPLAVLVRGYKEAWDMLYSPKEFYERICIFMEQYNAVNRVADKVTLTKLRAFAVSIWRIGLFGGREASRYYWKTLAFTWRHNRRALPEAVTFQVYGYHFRMVANGVGAS